MRYNEATWRTLETLQPCIPPSCMPPHTWENQAQKSQPRPAIQCSRNPSKAVSLNDAWLPFRALQSRVIFISLHSSSDVCFINHAILPWIDLINPDRFSVIQLHGIERPGLDSVWVSFSRRTSKSM